MLIPYWTLALAIQVAHACIALPPPPPNSILAPTVAASEEPEASEGSTTTAKPTEETIELKQVKGKQIQKVAGSGANQTAIWGITSDGLLVCRANPNAIASSWKTQLNEINLVLISAGTSEVWGASKDGDIFSRSLACGDDWTLKKRSPIPGYMLNQLSVYEGNAWGGAHNWGYIWFLNSSLVLTKLQVPFHSKMVSFGKAGVWILFDGQLLTYIRGTCGNQNSAGGGYDVVMTITTFSFIHVPVDVPGKYFEVWAIDQSGLIWRTRFTSCENINKGPLWEVIQSKEKLVQFNVGASMLWGVDKNNDVWKANVTNLI